MNNFSSHRINANGSINLLFGRAVEIYINSLPLLSKCKLKKQSRLNVNESIKAGFITLKRIEGAIDYLTWKTALGQKKSTNRIDHIIELTDKGRERVSRFKQNTAQDLTVWRWVFFYDGTIGCERACGGLGECKQKFPNFGLKNNLTNDFDMHKCGVIVITKVMLSNVKNPLPVQLIIKGVHRSSALMTPDLKSTRINLSLQTYDKVIVARRAHHNTGTEIAMKVLAPYNNTNETYLTYLHNTKYWPMDNLGPISYYTFEKARENTLLLACDFSAPENSFECYYQLTVSNELWLKQGCDCGQFCFGIDGKYDLNNEKAPVIAIVIEDQVGYGSLLAFSLCYKENHYTIRIAVQAVQANIPCNNPNCLHQYYYSNLPDGKGFLRQLECTSNWYPLAMIDKYRPTKLALQGLVRALAFKIVGRSKSDEEVAKIEKEYEEFINFLPRDNNIKDNLIRDLQMNWICDEWRQSFIDGGRMPQVYDQANVKPMTTNNFTEWMHKIVEARRSEIQTVVKFIERLSGIRIFREALVQEELGEINFDAGHLYVLLGLVLPIPGKINYMLVKKQNRSDEVYQEILQLYSDIGNNIFFLMERMMIATDPFRPINDIPIPVTSGHLKTMFDTTEHTHLNEVNQECCNENSFENSILSEIPINCSESAPRFADPHSIRRRNTTRIQNKYQNCSQAPNNEQGNDTTSTIKRLLEELFHEKECAWNPKEFTNAALAKRLRLDDNPAENGMKLYR
ncbi:25642_t:CDS:2 [Gigaspora rosea]|nr:25642_t:CDS:2 [Gigaspora rosea]